MVFSAPHADAFDYILANPPFNVDDVSLKAVENDRRFNIYGMLTLPSDMFYTVTLPATLWFFDKTKTVKRILFIDARNISR